MSETFAFERDPRLTTLHAKVLDRGLEEDGPWVVLDDTVLYPEGGGQPADRGWIGGVEVLDVRRVDGTIRHRLAASLDAEQAEVELDWTHRFDHMQQHTAQHLITAVAADQFGWPTTSFHLGEHVCDVELDVPVLPDDQVRALEEAVAAEVRAARSVTARRVSPTEYRTLEVRSRGLPDGHEGSIRLVEIEGLDLNTCGGTHCATTAELEAVKLLGTESVRGGTRLFFVAGGRLRRRLGVEHDRTAALRALLGASDDELVESVERRLDQLREAARVRRRLEDELAAATATALVAQASGHVVAHLPDRALPFLQDVARRVTGTAPDRVVLLTGGGEEEGVFLVAAGEEADCDVPALGPRIANVLEGNGGGRGSLFQGRAARLSLRGEAARLIGD